MLIVISSVTVVHVSIVSKISTISTIIIVFVREMLWEYKLQASFSTASSSSPKLSRVFL